MGSTDFAFRLPDQARQVGQAQPLVFSIRPRQLWNWAWSPTNCFGNGRDLFFVMLSSAGQVRMPLTMVGSSMCNASNFFLTSVEGAVRDPVVGYTRFSGGTEALSHKDKSPWAVRDSETHAVFGAAVGAAHVAPVGGLIAGGLETAGVYEGF